MIKENLELELTYNSIFGVLKDFEHLRYKLYLGSAMLFIAFLFIILSIYDNTKLDTETFHIIFLTISFPFFISTLFDYYTRRIKIRIYSTYFEIPIAKSNAFGITTRTNFQRVMTKYKFLKLTGTRQHKDTYTLQFLHEIEDITIENKCEFILKSLNYSEISKLHRVLKEKLVFTNKPYYRRN